GEGSAHDALVRPGSLDDDGDRAIRAVERRQVLDHFVERVDGEVDGKRRAGRAETFQRLAVRHGRGAAGNAGEHEALCDGGDRELTAEGGGGGGEGGHARRHRIGK